MNHIYLSSINEANPDLSIEHFQPNEIGQNNDVLIINDSLVFRFPKFKNGIIQLKKETAILDYIHGNVSLPVPRPLYQSFEMGEPGKVFTGYRLIEGVPFFRDSFKRVTSIDILKGLATQLVTFLIELHSVPKEKVIIAVGLVDKNPHEKVTELFNEIQSNLFPFIRKTAQTEITHSFRTFLDGNLNLETTLIHGDFGATNILWNPETNKITGIIDFGNSGIGDPAYDFAGVLSSYGEEFYEMCVNLYPNGNEISERVKFYKSTFALQEALHGLKNNDSQAFENGIKDYR